MKKYLDSKPLKAFARTELNECPILQHLLLAEPDHIEAEECLVKMGVWLRVLDEEVRQSKLRRAGRL
ncbi:MAG: hypothetical protein J4431_04865 [Candidatus Aenigmarchaeota archaeon]|nr:hypothetical protein [Candidatus Aenigmarchaeota archaeon]